jgi:acyl-CoA reductase-like NAD-dependent aldehyde dehydrogenase
MDGRRRSSDEHRTYSSVNPATELVLYEASAGDTSDVDEAVRAARRSFEDGRWSQRPPTFRAQGLIELADLIVQHAAELALLDTLEMGKPIRAAREDAERFAPLFLRSAAGFTDKLCGESAPSKGGEVYFNAYEPRGVVGLITPWNYPVVNVAIKLAPALAAGNSVVVKPSELAASSALRLAELALEAGVPEGVLNVVPGLGTTVGAALSLHPDVDLVSFTGSTATGRKVMEMAGRSNGKPVLLECGGKCPQIVFEDVRDLDAVAEAAANSFLWNQGQVCSAHTRLVVHASLEEALVEKIVVRARAVQPGDPLQEETTFGPLASAAQRDRVKNYMDQGIQAGAHPVLKGRIQNSGGCYVSPTVFDRVMPQMAIAREEIFGPVLVVQTFKTEEQAIALANGTEYGLAATVWTCDLGRAKRLARAVKAGHITVRTGGAEEPASGAMLSHEPQRASGFGSETGIRGLQCYSTLKSIRFSGA